MSGEAGGLLLLPLLGAAAVPILGLYLVGAGIGAAAGAASDIAASRKARKRARKRREAERREAARLQEEERRAAEERQRENERWEAEQREAAARQRNLERREAAQRQQVREAEARRAEAERREAAYRQEQADRRRAERRETERIEAERREAERREEAERKRRERARLGGISKDLQALRNEMENNFLEEDRLNEATANDLMNELNRSRNEMARLVESEDPERYRDYMGRISSSRKEATKRIYDIENKFTREYQTRVQDNIERVNERINTAYQSSLNELKALQANEEERRQKARSLAKQYLEEAEDLLSTLKDDYEGERFVPSQVNELEAQLNAARRQYSNENYQAALSVAKDVTLSSLEECYKADGKRQEWGQYYDCAMGLAEEITAYMEAQAVITEDMKRQMEEKTERELPEDIIGIRIADYTDKRMDGQNEYDHLLNSLKQIRAFLEGEDADRLSVDQLKNYVETLNSRIYPAATLAIYKGILNMSNAFSRQNISEEIIDFFEDHNFSFKGYSYDNDAHDGPLHVGLENESTGEEIIVTLAPELMENGDVQTKVEIDQLMGDEANEDRKAFYRASVENVVVENTPGARIKLECRKETRNRLSRKTELRDKLKI
ncbi:MAG: hypothetical protein K5989_10995 [Lachnospiraceae bacterium]|nr:hypothetical protein [Lachnospiraceae bacterium]